MGVRPYCRINNLRHGKLETLDIPAASANAAIVAILGADVADLNNPAQKYFASGKTFFDGISRFKQPVEVRWRFQFQNPLKVLRGKRFFRFYFIKQFVCHGGIFPWT